MAILKKSTKENIIIPSMDEVLTMAKNIFSREEIFYMVKFKELYPSGGLINAKSALETAKCNVLKKINVQE